MRLAVRLLSCALLLGASSVASCHGCDSLTDRKNGLPELVDLTLPNDPKELHTLSDHTYWRSRKLIDLLRARLALHKALRLDQGSFGSQWRLARIDGVLARIDEPRAATWVAEARRAAESAITLRPDRVEGHLYFAIATGLAAKLHAGEAIRLLETMVASLTRAIAIDPRYNQGEPRRVLGATYLYAPAWPTGVGDLEESIAVLKDVAREFPHEPQNLYFLADAYRKAEQRSEAVALFRRVLASPRKGLWAVEGPPYRTLSQRALSELVR